MRGDGEDAQVWDIAAARKQASMPHARSIATLTFNEDCTLLATASARRAADSALAELHWRGEALEKDRANALALWRAAALKHDAGACQQLAEMEESGSEAELPRDLRAALLHWTLVVEFSDQAGTDDRFARARRASLARRFSHEGQSEVVAAVWREALQSLGRQ